MSDDDKAKFEKSEADKKEKEDKAAEAAKAKKDAAEKTLADAVDEAKDDLAKLEAAISEAKKNSAKPDTSAAEGKLADAKDAEADKATEESAKSSAGENWLLALNSAIDALIQDATKAYQAETLNKQKAGMDKFYDGGNKAGDDYELTREYLEKVLVIGAGDFEGFVQALGFTTAESDALEAVKGKLPKSDDEAKESKD